MKCPVCDGSAQDITEPGFDLKSVKCDECGCYDITGTVMHRFEKLSQEERKDALHKAKRFAKTGKGPVIDRRCF